MAMPGSTPSRATPRKAAIDRQELGLALLPQPDRARDVGEGQRRGDHHGGQGRLGQVPEQAREQHEHEDDQHGAGHAGELGLRAGAFGHRGPGSAGADREALEEAGGQVRGADADHLLVAADLLPGAGGERRRGGDRVRQGHQGDTQGTGEQRPEVGQVHVRDGERREALGQDPDQADAVVGQVEDRRGGDREHHHDEHRRDLRQPPLQHQDQHDPGDADRGRGGHRLAVGQALDEADDLTDQVVGVDLEPEQLGQLADQDGQRQAVHVADHRRLGDQVGDEAELGHGGQDHDRARP